MSDADFVQAGDPEEAFAALADETRVAIIRALWDPDHEGDGGTWPALTFSELREAVGMRDSGQFNYHLDQLRDVFVRKTERGYTLTMAGREINGAVLGGVFTLEGDIDPITLDSPCELCGAVRVLTYENERVQISCTDCSTRSDQDVPPGVLEGLDREAIPPVAVRYFQSTVQQLRRGFCSFCDGRLERDLVSLADIVPGDGSDEAAGLDSAAWSDLPLVSYKCPRCAGAPQVDLATALLDEPSVVSFYHDHGVDVRDPSWWLAEAFDPEQSGFLDQDGGRAYVDFEADDERLRVVVDDDIEVRVAQRSERA